MNSSHFGEKPRGDALHAVSISALDEREQSGKALANQPSLAAGIASIPRHSMIAAMQDRQDHFAYCVQLFGGTTAFSRRLGIDERAIRRFINGERPITDSLFGDTARALRELAAEAAAAAERIAETLGSEPEEP